MNSLLAQDCLRTALDSAEEICGRYQISALQDFLESCRTFAEEDTLNIAIFGRFKAGKSSFLNNIFGRQLLPVGVIPVTTVVTEVEYGPKERAQVQFLDGHVETIPVERVGEYLSEAQNPENNKQSALVRVELPSMERYRGIRFVDTPGLESVLEHNTDASMDWLPNVGLALVAVGVDPPLSQHDIELIQNLNRYTPNISLLLTKVDLLSESDLLQVRDFVRKQLARYWSGSVPIFPYSVKPGFEHLRAELDKSLLSQVYAKADEQRAAIMRHKVASLLGECTDYLNVALKAAQTADTEREQLRQRILGQKESLDDTRLALRLIVRHAAGNARSTFESILKKDENPLVERTIAGLNTEFPGWTRSLSMAIDRFDDWLRAVMTCDMTELSSKHRGEFMEPVHRVARQLSQSLQDFRNRLSARTLEALGVPLRTTEIDIRVEDPRSPDVRVGKIFDRNWELLSFIAPMNILKGAVKKHFEHKVADVVFKNLSRLASQWEDVVRGALGAAEKESARRLDGLIATIERLITSAGQEAPRIREDIDTLESLRSQVLGGE
jgi:GTP-binding protein EngB required for normal cell division